MNSFSMKGRDVDVLEQARELGRAGNAPISSATLAANLPDHPPGSDDPWIPTPVW